MKIEEFKKLLDLAEIVENVEYDWQINDVEDEITKIVNTFKKKGSKKVEEPKDDDAVYIKTSTSCSEEDDPKMDDENHKYKIIISVELPIELEDYHIDDITELVEDYLADEVYYGDLDDNEDNED